MPKVSRDYIEKNVNPSDIKALYTTCLWRWVYDASIDWFVIVATFCVAAYLNNPIVYVLSIFVIGNRQHALSCLAHDGAHYTLSRNKKLNDFIVGLMGWYPVGITNSGYRNMHHRHHNHLNTEDDPEIHHKGMRSPQWDLPASPLKILGLAIRDLFGYSLHDYWIIISFSKPDSKWAYVGLVSYHLLANVILFAFGLWWVSLIWYISVTTTFMMFFRLRLWLEHQGTDWAHRLELNKWEEMLFYPHKTYHHWEHHQWPAVPYHKLPELRALIADIPVVTLKEVLNQFEHSPSITSGTPLRNGLPSQ